MKFSLRREWPGQSVTINGKRPKTRNKLAVYQVFLRGGGGGGGVRRPVSGMLSIASCIFSIKPRLHRMPDL